MPLNDEVVAKQNIELCEQYFRYISGDQVDLAHVDPLIITEDALYEERILSILGIGENRSKKLDDYMISRRVATGFLRNLWNDPLLQGSIFLVKGLSIEKFYERNATRHSFDFDLVVDSEVTLAKIQPYLEKFLYTSSPGEPVGNRFRYVRSDIGGISIEINVGGVSYISGAKRIDWRFLSLGAYAAYYEGTPILTPSDSMTLLILLISLYEKRGKFVSLRDICDMALLSSKFQLSPAEARMIAEFLAEGHCIEAIDHAAKIIDNNRTAFPMPNFRNSQRLLSRLKEVVICV